MLTFEPWHNHEILVRFEHILEKDEDPKYSQPVQLKLNEIFVKFKIREIRETTLDGSVWLNEQSRLNFKLDKEIDSHERELNRLRSLQLKNIKLPQTKKPMENDEDKKFTIELGPMQIKTFVLYMD